MYARGDTSNVTIPSLFTSHTTAHLLSSLVPQDDINEDGPNEEGKKINKETTGNKKGKKIGGPTFTAAHDAETVTKGASPGGRRRSTSDSTLPFHVMKTRGWFRSLLSAIGFGEQSDSKNLPEDRRRPPSS